MSHFPQRKEKDCLNCGTTVVGKYCHNCGQENSVPRESVWHLISHFFNDITHFDGKFFSTLKDLLFKPGFLPKEYMKGRRASYLNPVRMYIFTSFIFFLIFFSTFNLDDKKFNNGFLFNGKSIWQINKMNQDDFDAFTKLLNHGNTMTREELRHYIDSVKNPGGIKFGGRAYKTNAEYDSVLASGTIKDNWFERQLIYKGIEVNQKYGNDKGKAVKSLIEDLMHHFPQMLFVSLPFLALFLKLLYIRRKDFYYVSHAIFAIHFYIFVFIAMLVSIGISKMENFTGWDWMSYINVLISLIVFFYLYKAMRNFYKQRRAKTILKYFLLLFSFLFLTIFLFLVFLFISIFQL